MVSKKISRQICSALFLAEGVRWKIDIELGLMLELIEVFVP
jgi:hypothetical protein